MSRIYPQLSREDSLTELAQLEDLLRQGRSPTFMPGGTLHPRSRFNGYGGSPVDVRRLRELHDQLESALDSVTVAGRDADRRFDVAVGNALVAWFEHDGRNQASNPEVWPYLTILVLPDLAVRRFGPDRTGRLPRDRYLSGRRNIFYRAYLRSWILGGLLSDPDLPLYEDDLVGLVDRNLSADHRIARMVGEQIRGTPTGEGRRETVREGLKALQYELRVTDLASLDDQAVRDVIVLAFGAGTRVRSLFGTEPATDERGLEWR